MDIYLVRHGEAAAHWGEDPDPGLSELGAQQAVRAAKQLSPKLGIGEVNLISSPLLRAQETAAPLVESLSLPLSIDEAFREVPAPVPLQDRKQWLQTFMKQQWQEQPDSLQAWRDAALVQLHGLNRPSVIFTHFLVLNAVVGELMERSETLFFWPDNASITHLTLTAGKLELVELGAQMETVVN